MNLKKIKNIIIFGGGTSGWLTAVYLANNLRFKTDITLIESTDFQPIGVGEGTQPYTSTFLMKCGIDPKKWMKPSQSVFKFGVELIGWNDSPYFVDNDHWMNHVANDNLFAHDYFIDKPKEEYYKWLPAYKLAKANKSPKIGYHDFNVGPGLMTFGAVHFSAAEIINTLKGLITDKISYVNTKIVEIKHDSNGITELKNDSGQSFTAGLYIDCTGFNAQLIEKSLGNKFLSYEKTLPCNRAVAIPTQYKNIKEECHPYTKATAMSSGWRWTIPIMTRIGNGYVYSDKFISPEQAENELRASIQDYDTPARHIQMKCGKMDVITDKNVCAVGLSAGFVEPLEATGITFTTKIVEWLTEQLNESGNVFGDSHRQKINLKFNMMAAEIHAFVWSHYYFSSKNDTEFWKQFRMMSKNDIPSSIADILNIMLPFPKGNFYLTPESMFHQGHWFSVLHAGDQYKNVKQTRSEDELKYLEYFIQLINSKTNISNQIFPNHYEFLKDWYDQ